MQLLIADSGSTKSTWSHVNDNGEVRIFKTEGYNPYFVSTDQIIHSLNFQLLKDLEEPGKINEIYFYGAGCSNPYNNRIVANALKKCFPNAKIDVEHDLLAAARALLFNEKGFAAILGTGTNSGLYDGKFITHNIDSLGYFLGDEGSGSYLGKKILRDHLRNYLPDNLEKKFKVICELDKEQIFDRLYNQPLPNRFLATFAIFFGDNIEHEYCRNIVREGFQDFFKHLVILYPNYRDYSFNCIGSIAQTFSDILKSVCTESGMNYGNIIRSPIERLVEYHLQHSS